MTVSTLPVIPDDSAALAVLEQHASLNPTGGRLIAWAEAAHAAGKLGSALARTSFVPKAFQGKPEECAAAIMCGDELGLSPLASLRSIFVVSGTPALYARTMVALVQSHGHDVITTHKTDKSVTVRGRRRGTDTWVEECWTTERARRAGYTSNKKYETDPATMLYARAAADVCRQIAADVLLGVPYTVEEMELAEPTTVKVTRSETTAGRTTVRRAVAAAPTEEEPSFGDAVDTSTGEIVQAEVVEPVEQVEPPEPAVGTISPAQTRMMGALMKELGITRREDALIYCIDVIGREIASRNELTTREASAVIDSLNNDKAAQAGVQEPTFDEEPGA